MKKWFTLLAIPFSILTSGVVLAEGDADEGTTEQEADVDSNEESEGSEGGDE